MNHRFTIAMDIDDVCADLMSVWLCKYNSDYNDNLTKDRITGWSMSAHVKPECGKNIYSYIHDPHIYDEVKPIYGALNGIKELRKMGHRIIFVTAMALGSAGRKFTWLNDNGFEVDLFDYAELNDKSVIIANYMLDDKMENITSFKGVGVLMTRPWNKNTYYGLRVNSWQNFLTLIWKASRCS